MVRFLGATFCGSIAATAVLLIAFTIFDTDDSNTITVVLHAGSPLAAIASVYVFVFVGGVLPTLLIGLKRGTPQRLVLTPAILFILVSAELAREAHSATLSVLPPRHHHRRRGDVLDSAAVESSTTC